MCVVRMLDLLSATMIPSWRRMIRFGGEGAGQSAWRPPSACGIRHDGEMTVPDVDRHKRPKSEVRQRQVMLAARVNPDEERRIRQAAVAQGISIASLIRKAV